MMQLESLYQAQVEKAELYQKPDQSELLELCKELVQAAQGFLHPHHRFLTRTYQHLAQFEPTDRELSQQNLLVRSPAPHGSLSLTCCIFDFVETS